MATYADYVTEALQLIGVLQETETASAEQGAAAIIVLNDMMAEWEADALNIGYVPSTTTTDTLALEASMRMAVKSNLAVRLCGSYERPPPPWVTDLAVSGLERILRNALNLNRKELSLRHIPGAVSGRSENIITGA